jgi:hypothetical protein
VGSGVRGDLLRWARKQQKLTMRWIYANDGPSPGYQSEVENGKKREVLSDMLSSWVALLNVSEAFARGQISRYQENPSACTGLAADICALLPSGHQWSSLTEQQRVRQVLRLVAYESRHVPRVVLAWVLDLELRTLDNVISGQHPVMPQHLQAAGHLTALPITAFTHSPADPLEQYLPVLHRAMELGVTPQELLEMIERRSATGSSEVGA